MLPLFVFFKMMGKDTKMLTFKRHCSKHYFLLTKVCPMQGELKTSCSMQLTQAGFFKLFKSRLSIPFIGAVRSYITSAHKLVRIIFPE